MLNSPYLLRGKEEITLFLLHTFNNKKQMILFTMESEEGGQVPFLDIIVMKSSDRRLGHKMFRTSTLTDTGIPITIQGKTVGH